MSSRISFFILLQSIFFVAFSQNNVDGTGTMTWNQDNNWSQNDIPEFTDNSSWANNKAGTIQLIGNADGTCTDGTISEQGATGFLCGEIGTFTNGKNGGTINISYGRIRMAAYTINNTFTLNLSNNAILEIEGDLTAGNNVTFNFGTNCDGCQVLVNGSLTGNNNATIAVQGGGEMIIGQDVDLGTGTDITIDPDSRIEVGNDFTVDGGTVTVEGCTSGCSDNGYLSIGGTVTDNGSITGTGSVYTPNDPTFNCPTGTTCETTPLPVTLAFFTGSTIDNAVDLEWKTSSEDNFHFFQLYKLSSDQQFELDKVYSTGKTSGDYYGWTDENPEIGVNVYQLKSVDFDGYEELFPAISLIFEPKDVQLGFYPNPTNGEILKTNIKNDFRLQVFTLSGNMVFDGKIESNEGYSATTLKPGLYLFRIEINGLVKDQKIRID
jgi:hypothetical protein